MKKFIVIGILFVSFMWSGANVISSAASNNTPNQISLTVGKTSALLDGKKVTLDAPSIIVQDKTLVPLRFIGETLGAAVQWDVLEKRIIIKQGSRQTELWIDKTTSKIDGIRQAQDVAPKLIKGRTMVPLRFIAETFHYQVNYQNANKLITIIKPNLPPQAKFVMDKTFAMIGETINYTDASTDPDVDAIVDRIWRNNNKSFQEKGIFTVSLKVKDSRGMWSGWFEQTVEVSDKPNNNPVAQFTMSSAKVFVNEPVSYQDQSYDPDAGDGDIIADWMWTNRQDIFSAPGMYDVRLMVKDHRGAWSSQYTQTIEVVEKPNIPPVAQFSVNNLEFAQGESVFFTDFSFDPDGDKITKVEWTGKQRAYFTAGPVPVTLKVMDGRGAWSEPLTITLNITSIVKMTEIAYNFQYPLAGETVNLTGMKPLSFPELIPTSRSEGGTVLLLSDSPEIVKEDGILYRDTATGLVRLMYYHANASLAKKRVYIIAENSSINPAVITKTKEGFGGPNIDVLSTGRNGLANYLTSHLNEQYNLAPGEAMILDGEQDYRDLEIYQNAFSMIDLTVSGNVTFTFVMVDAESDVLAIIRKLPILPKDSHFRGTFYGVDKTMRLEINGTQPQRLTLADDKVDAHVVGIDALTGEPVRNAGNYGVIYRLQIHAGTQMGMLMNPRGGAFRGVALDKNGKLYGMPQSGVINTGAQAVMNLTLNPGEETEFIFVPPAASNLPVLFLFIPFEPGIASW